MSNNRTFQAPTSDDLPVSPLEAPSATDFHGEEQETGITSKDSSALPSSNFPLRTTSQRAVRFDEEVPPAKPPRPRASSPQQQAEHTLIEAFPGVDSKVIRAVLVASGGQIEPAFNALLSMSDPDFREEQPPPRPPRPTQNLTQLQQDEMYARQLAQHYQSSEQPRQPSRSFNQDPSQRAYTTGTPQPDHDKEYSFFDDELPEIQKNIKQGFLQTQSKVNQWISGIRKKIDGEDDDEVVARSATGLRRQNFGPSQSEQLHGIRKQAEQQRSRRSTDRERYDADPQVLSDNFTELDLQDEETPPPKPHRPLANPNLFKSPPPPPQTGPVDEVDALYRLPTPPITSSAPASPPAGKSNKKWQPLTAVDPSPEADDDPFSLMDSDDEHEAKGKDIRSEDSERLKKAASETSARNASQVEAGEYGRRSQGNAEDKNLNLEPMETVGPAGTRNKESEELLKGNT